MRSPAPICLDDCNDPESYRRVNISISNFFAAVQQMPNSVTKELQIVVNILNRSLSNREALLFVKKFEQPTDILIHVQKYFKWCAKEFNHWLESGENNSYADYNKNIIPRGFSVVTVKQTRSMQLYLKQKQKPLEPLQPPNKYSNVASKYKQQKPTIEINLKNDSKSNQLNISANLKNEALLKLSKDSNEINDKIRDLKKTLLQFGHLVNFNVQFNREIFSQHQERITVKEPPKILQNNVINQQTNINDQMINAITNNYLYNNSINNVGQSPKQKTEVKYKYDWRMNDKRNGRSPEMEKEKPEFVLREKKNPTKAKQPAPNTNKSYKISVSKKPDVKIEDLQPQKTTNLLEAEHSEEFEVEYPTEEDNTLKIEQLKNQIYERSQKVLTLQQKKIKNTTKLSCLKLRHQLLNLKAHIQIMNLQLCKHQLRIHSAKTLADKESFMLKMSAPKTFSEFLLTLADARVPNGFPSQKIILEAITQITNQNSKEVDPQYTAHMRQYINQIFSQEAIFLSLGIPLMPGNSQLLPGLYNFLISNWSRNVEEQLLTQINFVFGKQQFKLKKAKRPDVAKGILLSDPKNKVTTDVLYAALIAFVIMLGM
ncbi:Hypothetical_protein [Hexamita inflata]|uniref:Hypothetical_protein n=1 Tax=Hexamita inflata TaxID=28002 RepID=A0AA86PKF9_9EUKA|nr:Hypothetical protein HINF_LOCUS26483 [Hexamita inflata]